VASAASPSAWPMAPAKARAIGASTPAALTDRHLNNPLWKLARKLVKAWGPIGPSSVLELEDAAKMRPRRPRKASTDRRPDSRACASLITRVAGRIRLRVPKERNGCGRPAACTYRHRTPMNRRRGQTSLRAARRPGGPGQAPASSLAERQPPAQSSWGSGGRLMNAFRVEEDMPMRIGMLTQLARREHRKRSKPLLRHPQAGCSSTDEV